MSITDHIEALKKKHAALDHELDDQNARPLPDASMINDLKRQKLAIKDEIVRLTRH